MHEQELRVRVGYQEDFPPFVASGPAGPEGLAVDILMTGFAKLGIEADWVELSLVEQIPALRSGDVDMLACLGVTAERQNEVVFGEPIIQTGGALFTLQEQSAEPTRIVTPLAGPLAVATQAEYPACFLVEANSYPHALSLVIDGHADAAALNFHVGRRLAEREFPGRFTFPHTTFHTVYLAPAWAPSHAAAVRTAITDALVATGGAIPLEP